MSTKAPAFDRNTLAPLAYGAQSISEEDIQAVSECLRSSYLTQGPRVEQFEKALAEYCGSKYAVAVNSGTAALHIAALAAGIGPGDEVITSPITFVASANCAFYVGAKPVFSDIDPSTCLMDPEKLAQKITAKTRAIIPVHLAGQSADMVAIQKLAKEAEKKHGHRVFVIEDAAHALGGEYKGKKVGSCEYSDMAILSFHPVKHITTGEGGAVLTNDEALYKKLCLFRTHGITRAYEIFEEPSWLPWGYEQHELGYNYRITDIQCALGISQLKRLDSFVKRRREIDAHYRAELSNIPGISFLTTRAEAGHAFHLSSIQIDLESFGGRNQVMGWLKENYKIVTQIHYIPVHLQPYYRKNLGTKKGDFPAAEAYFEKCLSIPNYPGMTAQDEARVIHAFKELPRPLVRANESRI